MYFLGLCCILLSSITDPLSTTSQDTIQEALTRWEAIRQPEDCHEVKACASTIQDMANRGDGATITRLMAIATNRSRPRCARYKALDIAHALADSAGVLTIVSALEAEMALMRGPQSNEAKKASLATFFEEKAFRSLFFDKYAESLLETLTDDERILSMAVESYVQGLLNTRLTVKVMLKCQVSQEVIDSHIIKIVEGTQRHLPESLLYQMSPAAMVQLRGLVSTPQTPPGFSYSATAALSYLGDEEIKPILEGMLPAAREHSKNAEASLLKNIWRIEVQNPPQKLLAYIEGTDKPGYRDRRTWAVKRARKLGVPTESIREAILAHATIALRDLHASNQ